MNAPVLDKPPEGDAPGGGAPRRRRAVVVVALLAVVAVVAVLAVVVVDRSGSRPSTLAWRPCGDGLQCSSLRVPIDRADPAVGDVDLPLVRIPSTSPNPAGSVVVNAGPLTGSTVELVRALGPRSYASLTSSFDVVAFDARGVGNSSPTGSCQTFPEERITEPPLAAYQPPGAIERVRGEADAFIGVCRERSAAIMPFTSSVDAADDLEDLRGALGEDKLRFLGMSYGSQLGVTYARNHPDGVGSMVLDSPIDSRSYTSDPLRFDEEQVAGSEAGLNRFLSWCDAQGRGCPLSGDARGRFDAIVTKLDANHRRDPWNHDLLTGGYLLATTVSTLRLPESWPAFGQQLAALEAEPVPTVPLLQGMDTGTAGFLFNACLDRNLPRDLQAYRDHYDRNAAASPHFGKLYAFSSLKCGRWPLEPTPRQQLGDDLNVSTPPVLVASIANDPAAPRTWSERLTADLGSARMLDVPGDGHIVTGRTQGCAARRITEHLLDPQAGPAVSCPAGEGTEAPSAAGG